MLFMEREFVNVVIGLFSTLLAIGVARKKKTGCTDNGDALL
jgi:hypothetical protein